MFDTPDLGPLCLAPFVAAFVGVLVYFIGSVTDEVIEAKTGKRRAGLKTFFRSLIVIVVPIACVASAALEIGVRSPAPWFTPGTNDIVGTWELTAENIRLLKDLHGVTVQSHELVFNGDGTFHLNNIPTFWGSWDPKQADNSKIISGSGTWHLGQVEGTERLEWVIIAQFQTLNGRSDNVLVQFYFENHLPPYTLITLDTYRGFQFQRK